ncbi:MAG: outer membrane lipoprotein-sorting protein [Halanaerobiales bacterium]
MNKIHKKSKSVEDRSLRSKNTKYLGLLTLILMFAISSMAFAITADEIINKVEDNEYYTSARMEADMIIKNGGREMTKTMVSISDGEDALVSFTNPMDRGTKYLKRDDELYMFFPDAEDIVHISGHMLNKSMMGSDFSYKDMMEADKLTDLYDFEIIDEEEHQGRPCYVIEGVKIEGKEDVQYYRRKMWIDKERFVGLKEELYAQSGKLLKVGIVEEVEQIEGTDRWFAMKSVMEDQLRRNTSTTFIIIEIEFDPEIPEGTFTLENLQS